MGEEVEVQASNNNSFPIVKLDHKSARIPHNPNQMILGNTASNKRKKQAKDIKSSKCKQCTYASSDQSNLTRHIKTVHYKIRNFKCEECGHAFARKQHLDE